MRQRGGKTKLPVNTEEARRDKSSDRRRERAAGIRTAATTAFQRVKSPNRCARHEEGCAGRGKRRAKETDG